jgi:Mrp family chromosome partitioning ATPase/predicted Fe-Mo cluster-binding NifX family protein
MSSCHCNHDGQQGGGCGSPSPEDQRLQEHLKQIKNKLLVMSGKGGVGKSSVATYLALGLAKRGHRVGLMDVDLHGPSIPRMLGISGMCPADEQTKKLLPNLYNNNLEVISIECLMQDRDDAIIWRGPVKHGVIRQFISEVAWGELDYLVIDSPPGTGDEPLSIAQTISDAQAVIVTTPQEVALADVRKSINFCRKVSMPILGLVENMSGLVCPHCQKEIALFSKGGGAVTSKKMDVHFLGALPFEPRVVEGGDTGSPLVEASENGPFSQALGTLVEEVTRRCVSNQVQTVADQSKENVVLQDDNLKFAIPLAGGVLTNHFGHCEQFAVIDVKEGQILQKEVLTPPPHEPGLLPRWLGDMGVNLIIAGGMGQRALSLFGERGVKVITGASNLPPEELVLQYLSGTLATGANVCDH